MIVKLARVINNTKQLNGWNINNENLYNTLNSKEKEAINILMIEQMTYLLKHERLSFFGLYKLVKKNTSVTILSDQIIEKIQLKALKNEIINQTQKK